VDSSAIVAIEVPADCAYLDSTQEKLRLEGAASVFVAAAAHVAVDVSIQGVFQGRLADLGNNSGTDGIAL
jgi:hypothetical protein